jgi:hypothetical protein
MSQFDGLLSGQNGASPWGVLYQSPLFGEPDQDQRARDAAAYGSMGLDPSSIPPISPFGPVPNLTRPAPAPPSVGFGAGAAPFGFAGPGSMQVDPSMLAPPPRAFGAGAKPVPFAFGPVTAQPPAGPPTNLSSANRPPPAPGVNAPSAYVPIGTQADGSTYSMPMFGRAPAAATTAAPQGTGATERFSSDGVGGGLADRLSKATMGFIGNLHNGPVGALAGGLGALVTGRNTDPSSIEAAKSNATVTALRGRGASPADVQAALNNPDLMKALINQYYGPKAPAPGSIQNGYRFRGGHPADRNNWEPVR